MERLRGKLYWKKEFDEVEFFFRPAMRWDFLLAKIFLGWKNIAFTAFIYGIGDVFFLSDPKKLGFYKIPLDFFGFTIFGVLFSFLDSIFAKSNLCIHGRSVFLWNRNSIFRVRNLGYPLAA